MSCRPDAGSILGHVKYTKSGSGTGDCGVEVLQVVVPALSFSDSFVEDATRDATGAKPGKPQIAAMSHPTQLLHCCDAMRCDKRLSFGVRFDLFYSKVVQRFKSCL